MLGGEWRKEMWDAVMKLLLGKQSLKMRWTKVSCKGQLYSESQTIYTLRVKKSHMSKKHIHGDKQHVAKI